MKKKLLFLTLFFLFFQLRSYVYIRAGISLYLTEQNFREEIQKAINSDATGILSNYPLSSVFVKMKFFPQSKNIHALSLSLKSRVVADNVIDKELLRIDGQSVEDDITTIQKKIASTQLKNFIFFDFHDKFFQNYDPKQKILLSIMNNCRRTTILSGFSNNRIYHFKECEFSK